MVAGELLYMNFFLKISTKKLDLINEMIECDINEANKESLLKEKGFGSFNYHDKLS